MQGAPFCLVSELREQLFHSPLHPPRLQPFAICELFLVKIPHNLIGTVAADPLAVQVKVDVDCEVALDLYCQV